MKKIVALVIVLTICFGVAACGGVDLQPAQDALTEASIAYNEVAVYMNENMDLFDEEASTFMVDLYAEIERLQTAVNDELPTEEEVADIVAWCGDVVVRMDEIKAAYGIE